MESETYNELRHIIANIWLDIEEGFNAIPKEVYWVNLSKDPLEFDKERLLSGDFSLPVPTKRRDPWLKAMNILKCFDVFQFRLVSEDRQFVQYRSLSDLPNGDLCYLITRFSMENFLSFCDRFRFDLSQPILNVHKSSLSIDADNVPIITVDDTRYYLHQLNKSTLVNMLKIALQPTLRNTHISKDKLNFEGSKPDVIAEVLGGEQFHLGISVNRLRKYRTELTNFPEVLDSFYVLTDKMIMGSSKVYITDEQLGEVQELAEYTESNRK